MYHEESYRAVKSCEPGFKNGIDLSDDKDTRNGNVKLLKPREHLAVCLRGCHIRQLRITSNNEHLTSKIILFSLILLNCLIVNESRVLGVNVDDCGCSCYYC